MPITAYNDTNMTFTMKHIINLEAKSYYTIFL